MCCYFRYGGPINLSEHVTVEQTPGLSELDIKQGEEYLWIGAYWLCLGCREGAFEVGKE